MTGQRAELIVATQMDLMAMGAAIEGGCAPQLAATEHEKIMTTATDLFARMLADPPKLTNDVLLKDFLRDRYKVAADRVEIMLSEYLRFLALAVVRREMTVPSPLIDTIWHHHIEDTRAYQDFCERVVGRFIHYTPDLGNQSKHPDYPTTLAAYELAFGEKAHPKVWPDMETLQIIDVISKISAVGFVLFFLGVATLNNFQTNWFLLIGIMLFAIAFISISGDQPWSLTKNSSSSGCGGGDGGGCGGD